jgi:hypothetical protein
VVRLPFVTALICLPVLFRLWTDNGTERETVVSTC